MTNELGFIFFRLIVPTILFGLQFLLYRRTERWIRTRTRLGNPGLNLVRSLFLFFNGAAVYAFIERPAISAFPDLVRFGVVYPFFLWHGATFFLGLTVFIGLIIKTPFRFIWWSWQKVWPNPAERIRTDPSFRRFDASRRTFLTRGMYGLSALSFGGTAYGLTYEKNTCEINTREITIPDLPLPLDGFSLALLSDVHSGVFMDRAQMEQYAERANALQTDQIIVAGDFVNSNVREVYPFAEAFSKLRAPRGVYGVLGNHDYYTGYPDIVAREIEDCGITLLRDDELVIQHNGGSFSLAGIDDVRTMNQASTAMERVYGSAEKTMPRILLCHRPYFLPAASERNVDLVMSGHTHGGQVVLGRFGQTTVAPASFASRYVWGLYRSGKTSMYVSRGLGTVGIPIRINCPPEITKIVLRSGSNKPPAA